MRLAVLALILLSACATPYKKGSVHEWTTFDTGAEIAVASTFVMDWNQTVRIGRACDEANHFLGKCPSPAKLSLYFPSLILGHAAVAYYSPQPIRMFWQGFFFFYEAGVVQRNAQLGYAVRF